MTRSILAIAAAVFAATAFASGAQACISCEYTPPVVNTPVYSHGAAHYKRSRSHSNVAARRAAKLRRLEAQARAEARALARAEARAEAKAEAKAEAQAKAKAKAEIETAKSAPVEVDSENSTISTASVGKSDTEKVELAPADEPKVSKAVSCKKFFPTVGMTLTVPCE